MDDHQRNLLYELADRVTTLERHLREHEKADSAFHHAVIEFVEVIEFLTERNNALERIKELLE